MEVKINSKKPNPMFNRVQVEATLMGLESTPSRLEVLQVLCKELGCTTELLSIVKIHQPFGSKSVEVEARVYDSTEAAKQFERGHLAKRSVAKTPAAVLEAAPAAKPAPVAEAKPAPAAVPTPEAK